MRVPDEAHPACLHADALRGLVGPEHVLPDRVARRGVVEGDLAAPRRRAPARAGTRRSGARSRSWVQRTAAAAAGEKVEMSSSSSTARSWLPTRHSGQRSADEVGALVGLGAVADDVAQAPDLVDAAASSRVGEHGLERGQVGVDVGERSRGASASRPRHAGADYRRRADEASGALAAVAPRSRRRRRGGDGRSSPRARSGCSRPRPRAADPVAGRRRASTSAPPSSSAAEDYRYGQRWLVLAGLGDRGRRARRASRSGGPRRLRRGLDRLGRAAAARRGRRRRRARRGR